MYQLCWEDHSLNLFTVLIYTIMKMHLVVDKIKNVVNFPTNSQITLWLYYLLLHHWNYTPTMSGGYIAITLSVRPFVHTFVTDISASTGRNDFIFDIWLWHGDLYRVSPFQVYLTSTSCLQCDLEFFMFALMKTFVTVMSASTGRNDFIFDI